MNNTKNPLGTIVRGLWTVGTSVHGMKKNAAREEQARREAQAHDDRKNALLAENTPLTGLADSDDLQKYRYNPDSVYLGRVHEDHGIDIGPVGITDPRGIFVQAGSRSGKGRSLIIQNAIRWPHPLLMIDPKAEAASITAMRRGTAEGAKGTATSVRKFLGQNVAILDPFGETKGPARKYRIGYDPLSDIDMSNEDYSEQIRAIVQSIVIQEQGSAGAHFSGTTAIMFRGIIETALLTEKERKKRTLVHCRQILFKPRIDVEKYLENCPDTQAGFGQLAYKSVADMAEEEWSALNTTMNRNLEWLGSPKLLRHLDVSDFSLVKAVQEGWSIYIVLPPTKMGDYKAWLRVIVRTAINAKVALGTDQTGAQTLFMLDEFPLLGHFQIIEDSAGFMAGYGIKLMPIIQNLTQLTAHYPKNWEAFFANAAATVAWALETKTDLENMAYLLGQVRVWEESVGFSSGSSSQDALTGVGGANAGSTSNLSRRDRPVRYPNEISEEGAPDNMQAFVRPTGGKPFVIQRINYDSIKEPGLYDSREFIAAWEKKFAGRVNR